VLLLPLLLLQQLVGGALSTLLLLPLARLALQ
jgi:hypothetical protein